MDRVANFWECSSGCPAFKTIGKPSVCPHCQSPSITPVRDAELRNYEVYENEESYEFES